jgi:hypothetical protein
MRATRIGCVEVKPLAAQFEIERGFGGFAGTLDRDISKPLICESIDE